MTEADLAQRLRLIARATPGPRFLGWPDAWFEGPRGMRLVRCQNDHVSTMVLKSELHGSLCLAGGCGYAPVYLTFPHDTDGPLMWPNTNYEEDDDS